MFEVHLPWHNQYIVNAISVFNQADYMKRYIRVGLSKSTKSAEVITTYVCNSLNFECTDDFSVLFDQEVDLRPMIRSPEIERRLAPEVVKEPMGLENDELLKKAPGANRFRRSSQLSSQAIRYTQVKEVEFWMCYNSSPQALSPGQQSKPNQGILEDFIV